MNIAREMNEELGLDRSIFLRRPSPGVGVSHAHFPLIEIHRDMHWINRCACALWARRTDDEDTRDAIRRARRRIGVEATSAGRLDPSTLLEPIDQVMLVAGFIFPGIKQWTEGRESRETLADLWWLSRGKRPGAAILRGGVLHLIGMDQESEWWMNGAWAKWATDHWRGPIVHHAIQDVNRETAAESSVAAALIRQAKGGGALCVLWTSTGTAMQPWRADLAPERMMLRELGEPLLASRVSGKRLALMHLFEGANRRFWPWLHGLKSTTLPSAKVPDFRMETPLVPLKSLRVKSGSNASSSPEQTPLFAEALVPAPEAASLAEQAFGEPISETTPLERLRSLAGSAKQEMMRAALGGRPKQRAHWASVLAEVEAWTERMHENPSAPPSP